MQTNGSYTATELRMLALLADGRPHTREELHGCLEDSMSDPAAVANAVCRLRKKLLLEGETVLCEFYKRSFRYRQVRLLCP